MSLPVVPGGPCLEASCSACCHGTEMPLTEADMERLAVFLADRPAPEGPWWGEDAEGYVRLATRASEGAPCVFLASSGRCGVYEARPEGCRLYPASWDEEGLRVVLDQECCPHTDSFRLPRAQQDGLRRLVARLGREAQSRRGALNEGGGMGPP